MPLRTGFNLEMWTGPNGTPPTDAFGDLGDAFRAAFVWDAEAQRFLAFSPDRPAFLNDLTSIDFGDGVWLLMDRPAIWVQPGLEPAAALTDPTADRALLKLDLPGQYRLVLQVHNGFVGSEVVTIAIDVPIAGS